MNFVVEAFEDVLNLEFLEEILLCWNPAKIFLGLGMYLQQVRSQHLFNPAVTKPNTGHELSWLMLSTS